MNVRSRQAVREVSKYCEIYENPTEGVQKVINCELVTQMRGNNTLEYFCQKTDDLI